MNKESLIENIKHWLQLENEMNELKKIMKEKRDKKKNVSNQLIDIMKANDIDCFDISGRYNF